MSKLELVFVPAPAIGHLVSLCKFAENLTSRDERLCITILVIRPPPPFGSIVDSFIQGTKDGARIRYITLAQLEPPSADVMEKSIEKYFSDLISSYQSLVKDAILSNKWADSNPKVIGLVADMFCSSIIDVANELGIPSYVFFTSGAGFLGFLLFLSSWHDEKGREFYLSDGDLKIPAFANPVPTKALPGFAFNEYGYNTFRSHGVRFKETKGILINTVAEFESHAVQTLKSDPDLPAVYTVGFLLDLETKKGSGNSSPEDEEILKWLDQQPEDSVLFLCFGSGGVFEQSQLDEMAIAIEQSEVRFVWSIRQGLGVEPKKFEEILPDGFLERTKNRGKVCYWAPQVEILAHSATGAFVSHCGWNSTLESLWHGVPLVTWPLYAEQQINAFQLVRDLGLAVELRLDYRMHGLGGDREIVKAGEIERAIKSVMDSENPVRKRVKEMGEICRKALIEGGSSFVSVGRFIETILES